MPLTNTQS